MSGQIISGVNKLRGHKRYLKKNDAKKLLNVPTVWMPNTKWYATFIFAFDLLKFKTNNNNDIKFKIEYAHDIAQILH